MTHAYSVFGIPVISDIPLPALASRDGKTSDFSPIRVTVSDASIPFKNPPKAVRALCKFNESEFFYEMPEIVSFFVSNGDTIILQPHSEDMDTVLLFFYSNALAAVLYQRNLVPFHASGIIGKSGKVWLFGAPSRNGKSTTALMLHEMGYPLFTDDVAIVRMEGNSAIAYPSYPMLRIWKNTIAEQAIFASDQIYQIRPTIEKYGIMIHDDFDESPREIAGIIFLEVNGGQTEVQKLTAMEGLGQLRSNIYRSQWANGMGKQRLHFDQISAMVRTLSFWKATRPKNTASYRDFALEIEKQIIDPNEK